MLHRNINFERGVAEMAKVSNVFVSPEAVVAPVVEFNRLAVANVEKLVGFYQGVVPGYVALGLGQLKAAAEVSSVESAQAFAQSQVEAVRVLNDKLVADGKALAELVNGLVAEYNGLVRERVAAVAPEVFKQAA